MTIFNVLGYVQSLTCLKMPSGCIIKPRYRVHENALTLLFCLRLMTLCNDYAQHFGRRSGSYIDYSKIIMDF